MKKLVFGIVVLVATIGLLGCSEDESNSGDSGFTPSRSIEWVVTSSAGGGSSIFTQQIVDIIKKEGLVDKTITINYQTDGGGAIGRRRVSGEKLTGHTLLTFNAGDLQPFVQTEGGDLDDLTPIAVMALDGQLILVRNDFKYQSIEGIIDALNGGARFVIGGSKSDDEAVYNAFASEVGGDIDYLRSDSTGEALTQLLGGHVDMVISKPAAAFDYVSSGELVPVVACGAKRFGVPFDQAPTFKELGYDIEFQIFRGVVGPKGMTEDEANFWSDIFGKVAETDAWKSNYLNKFLLIDSYLPREDSSDFMQKFEDIYTKQ